MANKGRKHGKNLGLVWIWFHAAGRWSSKVTRGNRRMNLCNFSCLGYPEIIHPCYLGNLW
jgi:hypothetical protein